MPDAVVAADPNRGEAARKAAEWRREGYDVHVEPSPISDNWLVVLDGGGF